MTVVQTGTVNAQYDASDRRPGLRRVLFPYVLLYVALFLFAVAVGGLAGDEVARAIGGPRHVGEVLGVVAALYVVRRVYVWLTLRLVAKFLPGIRAKDVRFTSYRRYGSGHQDTIR